jgi:molybdopterin synthase catalytic subunit
MITIQVRYFAVFRERLGKDEDQLALAPGATVAAAVSGLCERYPQVAALRGRFRVAVNCEFVDDARVLQDGDELALIPPVAGGSGSSDGGDRRADAGGSGPHARVLGEPLSLDRVVRAVSGPERGGVVTFTGCVRAENEGRRVERLEYEAYGVMAERVLSHVCVELEREFPRTRVAIEHRVGVLAVGEIAVVIAVAAPHRDEAFRACRAAIDRLKERAPIWKKEVGPDGSVWVGLGP